MLLLLILVKLCFQPQFNFSEKTHKLNDKVSNMACFLLIVNVIVVGNIFETSHSSTVRNSLENCQLNSMQRKP